MDMIENHMVVDGQEPKKELECGCVKYCKCDSGWEDRDA